MARRRPTCWPGTTAIAACCRGGRRPASARPLPGVALRDHAAADHREGGRALFRALRRALAARAGARRGAARGRAQAVGGARLLRARAKSARLRQGGGRAPWRTLPAERGRARDACRASAPTRRPRSRRLRSTRRAAPVDGNIERVVARLFAVEERTARSQGEHPRPRRKSGPGRARRRFRPGADGPRRHHLHAEEAGLRALSVDGCLRGAAARRPETFPVKAPKREGRLRRGAAFVVLRADGCVLVRSRPPKGLLGGMTEVPTTEWTHDFDERDALVGGAAARARATEMAPHSRRRHARVHAFSAGACGLCRERRRRHAGARRHALGRAGATLRAKRCRM